MITKNDEDELRLGRCERCEHADTFHYAFKDQCLIVNCGCEGYIEKAAPQEVEPKVIEKG